MNDYINHTRQYYSDGQYYDITLDESNTYVLVQTIYNGENTEGQLYAKNFRRYDGVTQFSEVQVIYDENGNVIFETYFDHVGEDGVVDKTAASKIVMYTYDENNNVKKYTETYYDVNGDITTQSRAEYTYDEDNDVIERLESGVDAFGEYTFYFKDIYDEDKNLIRTEQYNEFMGNRYLALVSESEYDEEGRKIYNKISFSELYGGQTCSETYYTYESGSVTVTTKDYNSGTVSTVRTDQIKDDNGNVISETVYNVGPGADGTEVATEVSKTEYTYDEQGNSTGYSVSTPNAEGGFDVTYYTAEGYPYQKAIYDTNGQLLMVMRLDENAPDEAEKVEDETVTAPTEGEDTVTNPTEGEDTVTNPTEGEDTVTDPTEGEDTVTDPTEGEGTVTDPTEGEDTVTDPTEGEDTVTDPTEGEDTVTDPTEGEDTVTDPTEGEDTVTDPTEGEDTVTDPTEGEDTVTDLTEGEDTVTGSATE